MITKETAFYDYQLGRTAHWDAVARDHVVKRAGSAYYHARLQEIYRNIVAPNQRVLELGCGAGDLLASLEPSFGKGVDFSPKMIARAKGKYPRYSFVCADAHDLKQEDSYDYIILSDLVNDLWDVQTVLEKVRQVSSAQTRIIFNVYSHLWEWPLALAQKLGLSVRTLPQNWLTVEDLNNLLELSGFEVLRTGQEILIPVHIPLLTKFANKYLVKLWPFKWFALTNVVIAMPKVADAAKRDDSVVSVIVPARNEEGNIEQIVRRVPEMGLGTELIFVEGGSTDNTYEVIQKVIAGSTRSRCALYQQNGKGKGDAVRLGFEKARGDVLMILDADMTVSPEDLPRFYRALVERKTEFVNGVRLVYPMEKRAMRMCNIVGNKFFSRAFSWLLGQEIKDTLCGTKVLFKSDYERIVKNRHYFGDFDPFGDFDLIFGAAKANLKIADMPIRYRERTYGDTNISRWRHGWVLLKMVLFAARRIKFR